MEVVLEIVKTCIPIIVGALIAIIPTMIEKSSERRHEFVEKRCQQKQEMYVELISLFSKVLKNQCDSVDLDTLRDRINLISITGSADVVRALNEYIDTWGKASSEEQNEKYSNLLQVIRVDLKVDKKRNEDFHFLKIDVIIYLFVCSSCLFALIVTCLCRQVKLVLCAFRLT